MLSKAFCLSLIELHLLVVRIVKKLELSLKLIPVDDFVTLRGNNWHLRNCDHCKLRVQLIQALFLLAKYISYNSVE